MSAASPGGPVRILALAPDLGPSEPATVLSLLAARLPPDRYSFAVGPLDRRTRSPAGAVTLPFHMRGPLDPLGWRRRRDALRDYAPEVIHAFGTTAARAARLPVLPGLGPRPRPRVIVSHADRTTDGLDRWLARLSLNAADRVIATTNAEADRLSDLGVSPDHVTVIPSGVPPATPARDPVAFRRALDVPYAARVVVAAGRFDAASDLRSAVWAFDVVKYVAPDLHLVLVGDGPDRARVEGFARAVGFDDDRVRFADGRVSVTEAVAAANVVWVTHAHGGVDTALAAMAAGRPVVAFGTQDVAEILTDGVTGHLVPPRDRVRLAAVTLEVLKHPDAAARVVGAAREVAARFPAEAVVARYAQVYDELTRGTVADTHRVP